MIADKLARELEGSPFFGRPLLLFCLVFLAALFCSAVGLFFPFAGIVVVCAAVKAIAYYAKGGRVSPLVVALCISLVAGRLAYLPLDIGYERVSGFEGQIVTARVYVKDILYSEAYGSAYEAELITLNGEKVSGRATLNVNGQYGICRYDEVTVTAVLSDMLVSGGVSDVLTAKSERLYAELETVTVEKIFPRTDGWEYRLGTLRDGICERFDKLLGRGAAGFAKAIFLGERSGLTSELKRDMSALGISHVVAVSGLHTSVIASFVMILASKLRFGRKVTMVAVCAIGVLYVPVAGFSYSVMRAVLMLVMASVPFLFGRRGDSLTALGVSGAAICAVCPQAVISCSFLLSFFATLGIVLSSSALLHRSSDLLRASRAGDMRTFYKVVGYFFSAFAVGFGATLFTVPVLALYFGEVSFVAVLVNLVAVPCATAAVLLAISLLALGSVPLVGTVLVFLFETLYGFLSTFTGAVAGTFTTSVSLGYRFFGPICVLFAVALVFMRLMKTKEPALIFIPFATCVIAFAFCLQVHLYANAGRAEAIYIVRKDSEGFVLCSGDEVMYVDIGDGSKTLQLYAKQKAMLTYSRTGLDAYMLTHYHSRHIGTLRTLLSTTRIGTLYLPYPETENEGMFLKSIMSFAGEENIVMYKRGEAVTFGHFTVTGTPYALLERSAHPLTAIRIEAFGKSLAFCGSALAESPAYAETVALVSDCRTFVLGRHGPVTKFDGKLLGVDPTSEVWCSPFEDSDERTMFPGCLYRYLEKADGGITEATFIFGKGEEIDPPPER